MPRKICLYCETETDSTAAKCPACGASMFTPVTHQAPINSTNTANSPHRQQSHRTGTPVYSEHDTRTAQAQRKRSILTSVISLFVFVFFIIAVISLVNTMNNMNEPETSAHELNETIKTERFDLKVIDVKKEISAYGTVEAPSADYCLVLVEIQLKNSNEDITINLSSEFYLKTNTLQKIIAENTGGTAADKNTLGENNLFLKDFTLSANTTLKGYIAFYAPQTASRIDFICEDREPDGDSHITSHFYTVDINYNPISIIHPEALVFAQAAESAGYYLVINEDYNDYGTYLVSAYKFAENTPKIIDTQLYVIDMTIDPTLSSAKTEFSIYADDILDLSPSPVTGEGENYEYAVNSGSEYFGIIYRINKANFYSVAQSQYRPEVMSFFASIGINISSM